MITTWLKLGLAVTAIGAACWGLSAFDHDQYLSLTVLTEWLRDAGPLATLLLIGSMACAVVIPPNPKLADGSCGRGCLRPVLWGPLCHHRC